MKWPTLLLVIAGVLLLFADVLAFHDFAEPHAARDWLMLTA